MSVAMTKVMTIIDKTSESEDLSGHYVVCLGNDEDGRVYTYGLHDSGLPELVIEGVSPPFLAGAAYDIITAVGDYLLKGERPVRAGETLLLRHDVIVRVAERPADADGHSRWALEDVPDVFCPECEGADHELWVPEWVEALARGESLGDLTGLGRADRGGPHEEPDVTELA